MDERKWLKLLKHISRCLKKYKEDGNNGNGTAEKKSTFESLRDEYKIPSGTAERFGQALALLEYLKDNQLLIPEVQSLYRLQRCVMSREISIPVQNLCNEFFEIYENGRCVIFNIGFATEGGEWKRVGADEDPGKLKNVFTTKLNLEYKVYDDKDRVLNKAGILEILRENLQQLKPNDILVCCILSHGFDGGIYDAEKEPLPLDDIFSDISASTNRKGPVVFFVEACQNVSTDCPSLWDVKVPPNTLLSIAATPGQKAQRVSSGTVYVHYLCKAFNQEIEKCEIVSLTNVLQRLHGLMDKENQEPFEVKSRSDLYFKVTEAFSKV